VTVRPLRQITGESEFGEVFFEDARVPRANVVGKIGEGWKIAMTVLSYERSAMSLAAATRCGRDLSALAETLRSRDRSGSGAREKLGRLLVENEVMRANGLRVLANIADGRLPGPESSIEKLYWSEFDKRFRETALDLLGPGGQLLRASAEGDRTSTGRATSSGRGPRPSSRAPPRCSETSSPNACSAFRKRADEVRAHRRPAALAELGPRFSRARASAREDRKVMEHDPRGFDRGGWSQIARWATSASTCRRRAGAKASAQSSSRSSSRRWGGSAFPALTSTPPSPRGCSPTPAGRRGSSATWSRARSSSRSRATTRRSSATTARPRTSAKDASAGRSTSSRLPPMPTRSW